MKIIDIDKICQFDNSLPFEERPLKINLYIHPVKCTLTHTEEVLVFCFPVLFTKKESKSDRQEQKMEAVQKKRKV